MKDTDFQPVLDEIVATLRPLLGTAGTVASYIPALACIDPRQLGIALRTTKLATASAEKALFYQVGVTAAVCPVISLLLGEKWGFSYSAWAWTSIGLQTVIGAFASYLTWMWLLRHYPATQMSSFSFLTPLFALVFGVVLLSEPLTLQLMLALVGVGLGIVMVNRRKARA